MNCPRCGEVCRCSREPDTAVLPRWMPDAGRDAAVSLSAGAEPQFIDPEAPDWSEQRFVASLEETPANAPSPGTADEAERPVPAGTDPQTAESGGDNSRTDDGSPEPAQDTQAWREELSARLSHYRSRHKVRPPRYPSLRLPFEDASRGGESVGPICASMPSFDTISNQALAQDWMEPESGPSPAEAAPSAPCDADPDPVQIPATGHAGAKIIEFPRSAEMAPPLPLDELAEPVTVRPRILEAPEVAPPPPALGGITMEAAQRNDVEKRLGIDIPLQSVSLARRLLATAVDGLIIAAASAVFALIFWKIVAVRPPMVQLLGLAAGLSSLFWAVYQYLLIVYSGSTPGLGLAGLEINGFDGTLPNRRLRRWRVLASCLSAASLGMGYAWAYLDEDSLCWHDRITHTYLARRDRGKQ